MNTKRIVSLVISVILVLGAVVALSSCNKHEHEFAAEWSTDATNHWHAATCEHTEEKSDLAAHADADKDGKCDVCAYAMGKTPTPGPVKPSAPQLVTYTVTVKNSKGEVVPGVVVKLVSQEDNSGSNAMKTTDSEGKVAYEVVGKGWTAQIVSAPEGYASEKVLDEELGIELFKEYSFDDNGAVEIVLVDAPASTPDAAE